MATIPIKAEGAYWKPTAEKNKVKTCEELAEAVDSGNVGEIVSKHGKLILQYYQDVQNQATGSFKAASLVAYIGFGVLILTWFYTLGLDIFKHIPKFHGTGDQQSAVTVGIISAVLIEFIASVNFWLYSKASKQFGAFHICLERTHRYLVAYKIAEETGSKREAVLEKLACIMASAPMITGRDQDIVPASKHDASSTLVHGSQM